MTLSSIHDGAFVKKHDFNNNNNNNNNNNDNNNNNGLLATSTLQFPADLVTFTEEIPNGKLHFLCSES